MFGKKKENKIRSTRVSTVIGQGTQINGDVNFSGGLHVDGAVKGNVRADDGTDAILSLSELGTIEGEVHVPMIILNGAVLGNVFASEQIEMAAKSKVTGDVTYRLIEMAVGAEVNGRLLHQQGNASQLISTATDMPKQNAYSKVKGVKESYAVES